MTRYPLEGWAGGNGGYVAATGWARQTGGVAFLLARTVGLGEAVIVAVIVLVVVVGGMIAFRGRTDGDA